MSELPPVAAPATPAGRQDQAIDPSLPARTTFQEDLVVSGQRRINIIWEITQAIIAVGVVLSNMIVGVYVGLAGSKTEFPFILSSGFFLVIGFYFSRTNHEKIGGVGPKPNLPNIGR
jgi:hypothetical protein